VLNSVDGSAAGFSAASNTASATTHMAPSATAAVFSSTQSAGSSADPTDFFHHRKHGLG
jgi:hypothetical protein